MGEYDNSSKWMLQHHGDSLLRLGGIDDVISWRALQAESVQPRRLPDGLLEVQRVCLPAPSLSLVEISTYPELRLMEQMLAGMALVWLDCGKVPDALAIILCPRRGSTPSDSYAISSEGGLSELGGAWRQVELWRLSADDALALNDPGLAPWIPLMSSSAPPETLLVQCRQLIETAPAEEQENLLVVSQVLAKLRYNDSRLLDLLGGRQLMIESPLIQEIVDEVIAHNSQKNILDVLKTRFGDVPPRINSVLELISDERELSDALQSAVRCKDLDAFIGSLPDTRGRTRTPYWYAAS